MKNKYKLLISFISGMLFSNLMLGLRMLNPTLLNEALFYIERYKGLYFFMFFLISLGLGGIMIGSLMLLDTYYKKKEKEEVGEL